jgi:hypothetical protein
MLPITSLFTNGDEIDAHRVELNRVEHDRTELNTVADYKWFAYPDADEKLNVSMSPWSVSVMLPRGSTPYSGAHVDTTLRAQPT